MKRLSVTYLLSLLIAFTVVGAANSLLYALNLGEYRYLSFWAGRAEAGFGEFQARLLTVQAACFVPLSVFVGLPGMYFLHRHRRTATQYSVLLGIALGLAVCCPLLLGERKLTWCVLSILLGVVWALVFQRTVYKVLQAAIVTAPTVIPQRSFRSAMLICISPLLFVVSLFLPAVYIDARTSPLFGYHVTFFTFFFPAQNLGDFLACLFAVAANLTYISAFACYWLALIDSRISSWPPKLAVVSTACALLAPLPMIGGRLDSIGAGHILWLCAHAITAALLVYVRNVVETPR